MMSEKGIKREYVDPELMTTSKAGERGRIFDPIVRIRRAIDNLSSTVEKNEDHIVADLGIVLKQDIESDPGNRDRIDATFNGEHDGWLAEQLNNEIHDEFVTPESRELAGAIAELYIRNLQTYRQFDKVEGSRSRAHKRFNRNDVLASAVQFRDASLHMSQFVQDRLSQDRLKFVTPEESPLRMNNSFDKVIKMVNKLVGVKFTTANIDGNQAFNLSRVKMSAPPYSGKQKKE